MPFGNAGEIGKQPDNNVIFIKFQTFCYQNARVNSQRTHPWKFLF